MPVTKIGNGQIKKEIRQINGVIGQIINPNGQIKGKNGQINCPLNIFQPKQTTTGIYPVVVLLFRNLPIFTDLSQTYNDSSAR
ncbi:hypothetical protein [Bacillus sp. E(2018)]|uniref:hypothetical protein n=1 Tax=Bacillus sp. E(2018) TaxID=2502239 RepID=UPI0010F94BD5|nr:hypothetical protein [Bacillus sp. E(2018)]